jgi:hypothetical protein
MYLVLGTDIWLASTNGFGTLVLVFRHKNELLTT